MQRIARQSIVRRGQHNSIGSSRDLFVNPSNFRNHGEVTTSAVTWTAFPRKVQRTSQVETTYWARADASRDVQDEFCEWSVTRDAAGKIVRVTFTCEMPEYWKFLAEKQPDTVLQLYQMHINPLVCAEDLFDIDGNYIPRNKWNTSTSGGAMHCVHRHNSLCSQVEIVAAATAVLLDEKDVEITDPQELIQRGRFGKGERWSDPQIGSSVNMLARDGYSVSLANPVGVYFDSFDPIAFVTPDGSDAKEFWTWTRGEAGLRLRGVFEVPPAKGYVVGDISIADKGPIQFGAMLADFVTLKMVLAAGDRGERAVQKVKTIKEDFATHCTLTPRFVTTKPPVSLKALHLKTANGDQEDDHSTLPHDSLDGVEASIAFQDSARMDGKAYWHLGSSGLDMSSWWADGIMEDTVELDPPMHAGCSTLDVVLANARRKIYGKLSGQPDDLSLVDHLFQGAA